MLNYSNPHQFQSIICCISLIAPLIAFPVDLISPSVKSRQGCLKQEGDFSFRKRSSLATVMMSIEPSVAAKDHKEKTNRLAEVFDVERQLWTYVNSRGLLNADVQNLYRKACTLYGNFLAVNSEIDELQEIEYSLWKLHYKHIDEFRKRMSQNCRKEETDPSYNHENVLKGFKLFLVESSTFYQVLISKIKRLYSIQEQTLFYHTNDVSNQKTLHKCRFLSHHLLVRLGDLARYLEVHERQNNWCAAAKCYLEAAKVYPNGGNPHNQLAWLATNVGDEFLALYHCVRSLAVKEPFPDASNNLTVIFETNQSTHINSLSSEAEFNFLKPYERVITSAELQTSNGVSSVESDFWPLIVRLTGFFFLEYRLDSFAYTFGSTIRAMEALLAHDDAELSSALESYQNVNLTRRGPYRALHFVCVLIFTIQNLTWKPELESLKLQTAFAITFVIMGRVFERCVKGIIIDNSPLLPAVLVFSEWVLGVLHKVVESEMEEKLTSSMSYFFSSYVVLLNRLVDCEVRVRYPDNVMLWEDYEMRGYKPISQSHSSLNFSAHQESEGNFRAKNEHRVHRIIQAAIKLANDGSQRWMLYEKGRKFFMKEKKVSFQGKLVEVEESPVEEEEDIVFKPITRHNSAPLPTYMTQKEGISQESVKGSDESLRRASSLLIAQNRALIDALTSRAPMPTAAPRPPSLSAWVLSDERVDHKVGQSILKPIDEIASDGVSCISLDNDNEDERFGFVGSSSSPQYNYCAPTPSAPLLPEDATWLSEIYHSPPTPAPEWLLLRKEIQRLHRSSNHNNGMQQNEYLWYGGNVYIQEASSRFDLVDGWGYPVCTFQPVYTESIPPSYPLHPYINGLYDDQRRETALFHHNSDHQNAMMDVRDDQQQLLEYLNQKDAKATRTTNTRQ